MFVIEIAKISADGSAFEGEQSSEILGLNEDPHTRKSGPVRYRLFAEHLSNELVVRGTVAAELERCCPRCGEFFSTTVSDSSFLRAYDLSEDVEAVDVTPDLREAILIHLSAFSRCRPDCAGLCPRCGKNLNVGPCSCPPPPGVIRWDELDRLGLHPGDK